ncbi:TPA: hypothetical protein U1C15_001189 [Streptococcus suis]|nr:hypothetical protein [Streptococcus suis]
MTKQELEKAFNYLNMIELDKYFLFDNLELYNRETGETKQYQSLDEVLEDEYLKSQLDKITFNYF